jgi:hypothetical protein
MRVALIASPLLALCGIAAASALPERVIISHAREDVDEVAADARLRSFRDWSVICDNRVNCSAFSASRAWEDRLARDDPGDYARPVLRIFRPRGRNGGLQILVDFGEDGPSQAGLSLHANYDPVTEQVSEGYPLTRVANGLYALDYEAHEAFFRVSQRGQRAAVTSSEGRIQAVMSTSGLNASMTHMAVLQYPTFDQPPLEHRVELVSGPRPFAFERATISQSAAQRLHRLTCGMGVPPSPDGMVTLRAAHDGALVTSIRCGDPATAYSVWFVQRGTGVPQPISFPTSDRRPGTDIEAGLANAELDPATGEMTALQHVRGLRDCGWWRRWRWTGTGFELVESRIMPFCMGLSYQRWPVLYHAG